MIDEPKLIDVLKDMNGIIAALNDQNRTTFKLLEGALERITELERTTVKIKHGTSFQPEQSKKT